jgi:hypothetical protein
MEGYFGKEEAKQISKEIFDFRFSEWLYTHWGSADPYEYEKSFDTMMKACIRELAQLSAGPEPKDKNSKKNYKPSGGRS